MPVYPPAPPGLSGDLLSIHRLLQSPTQIRRRLRTFEDLRFVSDQILTQRYRTSGGAILYEVSEPIVNTRAVEAVPPGAEYPHDVTAEGVAALAAVSKWGQATQLTDEKIKRNANPGNEVDRVLRKVVNTIISKVDSIALAAVASAVSATQAASAVWTGTSATVLRDVELAVAKVIDLNQGYKPDTILLSTTKWAYMISDEKVATLRKREATDNPIYTGEMDVIAGLKVVTAPASNLPSDDVWIVDSMQLGGMADETEVDAGYTVDTLAVQVQSERLARRDAWDIWGRRITVPVVQEPGAGIRITSTSS